MIASSLQWMRRYFDPALTDSDLGRRMVALRYPAHQLLLEIATVALGSALAWW